MFEWSAEQTSEWLILLYDQNEFLIVPFGPRNKGLSGNIQTHSGIAESPKPRLEIGSVPISVPKNPNSRGQVRRFRSERAVSDEDVRGLNVAVDDASGVSGIEGIGNLTPERRRTIYPVQQDEMIRRRSMAEYWPSPCVPRCADGSFSCPILPLEFKLCDAKKLDGCPKLHCAG
jgi:hypothetical protein